MFKHPIEIAVEKAIRTLPTGSTVCHSHMTRGHVWAPQDAEFIESEVQYRHGTTMVITPHDGEDAIAWFVVKGPEGEILDQGPMVRDIDVMVAVAAHAPNAPMMA